ncbi:Carboxylesterase family, partial [Rhizoctonia solani]
MLSSLTQAIVALSLAAPFPVSAGNPVIQGSSGLSYIGLRNATAGQDYFLGIPFAQPPVGPLRFKPPVPWTPGNFKVVNATLNGTSCEQNVPFTSNRISEDCLTLNVYGGGFYQGEIKRYPGTQLLERANKIVGSKSFQHVRIIEKLSQGKPIIYVAMNYRLGIYGFPPGRAAADAGALNLAFKDQRLALQWIRDNIGFFGGDPDKVTIFGVSAGAISASYQTFYNEGKIGKLFRGMILESGLNAAGPNDPVREAGFQFLVNATGCLNSTTPFECVRNAPSDLLSQANKDLFVVEPYYRAIGQAPTVFGPTYAPNDEFFTAPIPRLMRTGKFAKVPFISGALLDEGTAFVDGPETSIQRDQDIINWLTARFPGLYFGISNVTAVKELLALYPTSPAAGSPYGTGNETFGRGTQYKRFASLFGDLAFQAPRRDFLRSSRNYGTPTWSYIFKERSLDYPAEYGIAHGSDTSFVMQTWGLSTPSASPAAIDLMETIGDYWVNFAYNLDPNSRNNPRRVFWPKYDKEEIALQLLASNVTAFKDSDRANAIDFLIDGHGLYS